VFDGRFYRVVNFLRKDTILLIIVPFTSESFHYVAPKLSYGFLSLTKMWRKVYGHELGDAVE